MLQTVKRLGFGLFFLFYFFLIFFVFGVYCSFQEWEVFCHQFS